jgi:hypothetical protein
MPIDDRLLDYIKPLSELLLPCEPVDTIWERSHIVILAMKKAGVDLHCPDCGKVGSPRGFAKPRLIRHLNFEEVVVWVKATFPRVYCSEHGHLVAKQRFCHPRCRVSLALEESLLQMICTSDQNESEFRLRFDLKGRALARIVDRSRQKLDGFRCESVQL